MALMKTLQAKATGTGNLVVLFGATTGRDGIGGASVLASQDPAAYLAYEARIFTWTAAWGATLYTLGAREHLLALVVHLVFLAGMLPALFAYHALRWRNLVEQQTQSCRRLLPRW